MKGGRRLGTKEGTKEGREEGREERKEAFNHLIICMEFAQYR